MRRCQLYQKSSIAQRRPISFMVIKRNRTPSSNISRALYLYPLGLSTRCVQSNILSTQGHNNPRRNLVVDSEISS